jgi:Bacterial protein of unknown function (Gcw_chp)
MKKVRFNLVKSTMMMLVMMIFVNANSQETSKFTISPSADLVSRYVWRGLDFGNAPAVQPGIEAAFGNLAIGAWGSYTLSASTYLEADLYASYSFDFGLDIIATDYYFPAAEFGAVTDSSYFDGDAHTFEIGLSQAIGNFYISGYYFLNLDADLYFEAGYSFDSFSIFAGAGTESYTSDAGFALTNIGISTSKEIPISETYSLPVTGALIINPDLQQVNIVFGVSF